MITKWKVFNFKSIRGETELSFKRLTIFAGANSSGKSTLIQSILLIAQTLSHKVGSRSVVLNGALTSLGQFDDLKSNGSESEQISIKCTCRPLFEQDLTRSRRATMAPWGGVYYAPRFNQIQEVACEVFFDADPSSPQRDLFQIQPRLFATQLSCTSRDDENLDQIADILIRHTSKPISEIDGVDAVSDMDDKLRIGLAYDVDLDESSMNEAKERFRSSKPIGCILRHFLPERIIYAIDTLQEDANAITLALQDDGPRALAFRRDQG